MPEDLLELFIDRAKTLDGQLDELDPACPEYEQIVKELEIVTKLIQAHYASATTAIDLEEKRRIDEEFKHEQLKNERRRCRTEIAKVVIPSAIAAGASIGGAVGLVKVKTAIEKEGIYLGPEVWKYAYNFILKIKN